ncbi:response regulator [Dehalococcoidia bacterium]|nr:response regulator [Dehalococcoidia bacterium]
MRVLIVDDEIETGQLLQRELQRQGCEAEHSTTAADVLPRLSETAGEPCEVLLLNLDMPKVNGLELLKEVTEAGLDLDVIVITADGDEDKVMEAIHLGAIDYLRKPISLEELRTALFRVRQRRAAAGKEALKHRVLVVDDEKDLVARMKQELEKEGYEVAVAYDGLQGLEYFNSDHVDAVIADIRMPGIDGLEMLDQCRAINPDFVPIIITGFGDHEKAIRSLKLGVFDYLRKPISLEELIGVVGKGLDTVALRRGLSARQRELEIESALKMRYAEKLEREKEAVEKSEEKYRSILQNIEEGYYEIDVAGYFHFFNDSLCKILGYSRDELMRMNNRQNTDEENARKVYQTYNEVYLTGETVKAFDWEIIRKDGSRRYVESSISLISSPTGHPTGFRGILRDITDRKQAEMSLKQSEDKYRSLVNNVKLGIFRSTPDPMGRFLEVNPAMEEITGYSRDELLRMNVVDLYVHPRERETTLELARLRGKTAREILFKRKEGTEITVWETKVAVKDDTGVIAYFDGILEDITERKILEQELKELYATEQRERRELEEEARARGQFINVLAHEMRTPLTPVMICAGMLRDALSSNPESTHFRLINNILTSAQVMVSRLDDLLDLARFSSGTFTLERQELDTRDFLKKVAAEFQPVAEGKDQRLVLELPETLPGIEADPSRLGQVLMNLLSNASKFSPEERTITLRAMIEGTELVVAIEDQGIGISSEEQARLFEPYHRIEQDRQALPGLGLGLVISKQIVEAHGGRLWLTSELGQGSTFCFSIPLRESGV